MSAPGSAKHQPPPQGACGWADLIRALDAGGPDLLADMAAVLGLEKTSSLEPVAPSRWSGQLPTPDSEPGPAKEPTPAAVPESLVDVPFWRVVAVEYFEAAKSVHEPAKTLELPSWTDRPAPASWQPLAAWSELLPRLRRALAPMAEFRALDVPAIVRRLERGETLRCLPRRLHPRWGGTVHIIEDRSTRLTPYWRDQAMVRGRFSRLFPRQAVCSALLDESLSEPLFTAAGPGVDRRYRPPPPGGLVLVLGDLGCLARDGGRQSAYWLRLGKRIQDAGCRAAAVVPLPAARCPAALSRYWRMINWERVVGERDPERWAQEVELLLRLLAYSARVEPGLLRDLRRFKGLDAATEAEFWQHPAVVSPSSVAATLSSETLKRYRGELSSDAERNAMLERLRAWRARLPVEVYVGEIALLDEASSACLPARDRALIRSFFGALSAQICGEGGAVAPRGATDWFLRFEQRSTKQEAIWAKRDLHRLWDAVHRYDPQPPTSPPRGFDPASIESEPGQLVATLVLHQHGDKLLLWSTSQAAEARRTGSPLARIETRNRRVKIEPLSFWKTGPPPWADNWGWDEFGAWVTICILGKDGHRVIQRMRWIEPGSFLMGSPEDEPERWEAEGPQHAVTIGQGFWLFDTACAQALWQAVMGDNPSHFKGADRPVENVSWHDVQRFIGRINERLPGLNLQLPTEAQWEYACRAGTTTPFSFGENITTDQVNYNGNYPYADAEKGMYRQETVPAGSLPPNPWGLYEMHGNVWEWVQDAWHDSYEGAPADGSAWQVSDSSARRVVRGGSWRNDARGVRSAFRSHIVPGIRHFGLGFRCARVQVGQAGGEDTAPPSDVARQSAQHRVAGENGPAEESDWPTLLRLDTAASAETPIPKSPGFLIRTDRERLTFWRTTKPEWASAMGRDRFGLWTEIAVEHEGDVPVIQRLRWIPPGRFPMGSPEDEPGRYEWEGPQHQVIISRGYWLFDTPCTQALWQAVIGDNPSEFKSLDRPVEQVSWNDVQSFLNQINDRIPGLELVLPSEAQWEYACRAGTETALYTGAIEILGEANAPELDPIAWYGGNSGVDFELENGKERKWLSEMQYPEGLAGTHPVKRKEPNAWGLYDMLGNVWEWAQDHWHDDYQGAPADGSAWQSRDTSAGRVIRGGSWYDGARLVRSACRGHDDPGDRGIGLGFRCARVQS
jgi:formylglycine-generating enzyme required for sulfatase activity